MIGQRQRYNPQKIPEIYICVAKWRSNSATVTHVSEDNLAVCGREIDQSTKFLRVACVIFYWCVFTLSFNSLFSFCWIDFPLVVHSTRWDNGINWRILFSIDEPLHILSINTESRHFHDKLLRVKFRLWLIHHSLITVRFSIVYSLFVQYTWLSVGDPVVPSVRGE